jgi:hypothetical protein
MQYILGVDTWEGNPTIDEAILKAAGVEFMIIRLNDMNGGHHKDVNFDRQWAEAAPFIRFPYFVYSPWYTGKQNFDFLAVNMPPDAKAVATDIEVRKDGYSPHDYATQVGVFRALVSGYWNQIPYSGSWFLDCLDKWPVTNYWWARYPFIVYPPSRENWTWDKLKAIMTNMTWNPGNNIPGPCKMWQITGDRLILPGCGNTCVDINAWSGTLEELQEFAGAPPSTPTLEERVTALEEWVRLHVP